MIVIVDPYEERGGGQAVLEELLERLAFYDNRVLLAMPVNGRDKIRVPARADVCEPGDIVQKLRNQSGIVLVSNANASHIPVLGAAMRLRRADVPCTTVAILHNYPGNAMRELVVKAAAGRYDLAIAVEPGLSRLRGDALVPSWLSAAPQIPEIVADGHFNQRVIKCFARPDRSKGLHLLPTVFAAMEEQGFSCKVALGESLEDRTGYVSKLKRDLAPWLVEGRRTPEWLLPGDIFLVPSIYGEAACLSAQEAMSRGAFVVASRVGLMPYLSPTNEGIRTFAVGDAASAIAALEDVAGLDVETFREECLSGSAEMRRRNGRWYEEVSRLLVDLDSTHSGGE